MPHRIIDNPIIHFIPGFQINWLDFCYFYFNAKTQNMKKITIGLLLSFIFLGCEKYNEPDRPVVPGDPVIISTELYQKEVIDSANRFAIDLFKPVIADAKGEENIMISPFSITSALSMTLNGAAGETLDAMKKALRMEGKSLEQINETYLKLMTEMVPVDKLVTLEIANSVWVERRLILKQDFISTLQQWYKADVFDIDVAAPGAVDMVNNWIADKTHDKITDMLDNLDPDLAMLLINAIYFNGKWRYQFNKADTREDSFYVTPDAPVNVPMMHQEQNFQAARLTNLTIIDIPYGQGNYSMLVVLPDAGIKTSELAQNLTQAEWNEWLETLANNTTLNVKLSMPKFKYGYKRLLNDDLAALGMGIAFTGMADFSNISDQGLEISRVIHQSFIETNEEGTEAAAATIVEIRFTSVNPDPMVVNIDRPFLYFIHEISTGTILFMGRVSDPSTE
jgi:serine protease inhibitor